MINVTPVILCGGSGTRLWPLSRTGLPKQFLCLTGNASLFQLAATRLMGLGTDTIEIAKPLIVAGEEHRFLAIEQLREIGIEIGATLLEPIGRSTAPALTLAALAVLESGVDPVLVVTPADQIITDQTAFTQAMQTAIAAAAGGTLVILGITPDHPANSYGYIKALSAQNSVHSSPPTLLSVERFVEKPDTTTAQAYLLEGDYYWNAGIFVLKASVWLQALNQFRPDIAQTTRTAWNQRSNDATFIRPGKAEFADIPIESIDYAIIEPCSAHAFPMKMVPLNAGWSDLGAWDTVWKVLPKDANGNAHLGEVLTCNSRNTLVLANSRLVSVVGVENLVVIETPDALLIAHQACSQAVKHIVDELKNHGHEQHTWPRKIHRSWGWYENIDAGDHFTLKRIQVKPGASISLQKHHQRTEHWIVIKGSAAIVCGDRNIVLTENQSTSIPLGEFHALTNPGNIPLEMIEVQSGAYLGENDIIHSEDHDAEH